MTVQWEFFMHDANNALNQSPSKQIKTESAGQAVENAFEAGDVSRIIEMAWEDRTPFEAIAAQYGLSEPKVILLMRRNMKASSFRMWRKRVGGRKTKHISKRGFKVGRFVCPTQRLR